MCSARGLNSKINNIHQKLVSQDKTFSCKFSLNCHTSTSAQMNNFQYLAIKLLKEKNGLSLELMKEIYVFQENETYNLMSGNNLAQKKIQTTQRGIETVSNFVAKLRDLLPGEIKIDFSLCVFKNKNKKWIPE